MFYTGVVTSPKSSDRSWQNTYNFFKPKNGELPSEVHEFNAIQNTLQGVNEIYTYVSIQARVPQSNDFLECHLIFVQLASIIYWVIYFALLPPSTSP